MGHRTALIAGVGGMCGGNMARLLHDRGWAVIGLSRTVPRDLDFVRHVPVDLLDPTSLDAALVDIGEVTHLFYTALLTGRTLDEENALNRAMMENLLAMAVPRMPKLEHVNVLEGVKQYGYHLGSYKTPPRSRTIRPALRPISTKCSTTPSCAGARDATGPGRPSVPARYADTAMARGSI